MTKFIKFVGTNFADALGIDTTALNQKIRGRGGDDTLLGGLGADKIKGSNGNDWMAGGGNNDAIEGGKGIDVAVYQGRFGEYALSFKSNLKGTVTDLVAGRDGADTVKDVEFLQFANGIYDVVNDTFQFFNQAPTLAAPAAIAFNDTAAHDVFADAAAALSASDPDGDSLTYGIVGGAADLSKAGYDTSKASAYGTLYLDSASGAYVFVPSAPAIEALKSPASTTFTLTVSDGDLGDSKTLTVDLNGVNDTAAIGGTAAGAVAEDGVLTAGGVLTISDADAGDGHFLAPASLAGSFGTFSFNAGTGAWGYTLNNASVQTLRAGVTAHDTLTVTSADGTASRTIDVSIGGANDAPLVSGPVQGSAAEDGPLSSLNALANASDIDVGTALAVTGVPASLPAGVSYNPVARTLTLNPAIGAYQYLADGQTAAVTVSYGVSDGIAVTPASASWTVTGVNDAPTLGEVVPTEPQFGEESLDLSASIALADVDLTDTHSVAVTELSGHFGTFTAVVGTDSTGTGQGSLALSYHLTLEEFMAAGGVAPALLQYRVTVDDHHGGTASRVVSIPLAEILSGAGGGGDPPNHNPDIFINPAAHDTPNGLVVDDIGHPNRQHVIGRLSFSDEDTNQSHIVSAVGNTPGPLGTLGTLFASILRDTDGTIMGPDPDGLRAASPVGGVIKWDYQVAENQIQRFGAGETYVDRFRLMLQDNSGGSDTQDVLVTIQGMNDAPVQTPFGENSLYFNGSFGNQPSPFTPGLQVTHTYGFIDPDRNDHHIVSAVLDLANSTVAPLSTFNVSLEKETHTFGEFDINGVVRWTYQLGDSAMPYLAGHEGQQRYQSWNVFIDDGNGGAVVPFVVGFNSAPVVPGTTPGLFLGQSYGNGPTLTAPVGLPQAGAFAFFDPDPNEVFTVSAPVLNLARSTVAPPTNFSAHLGIDGLVHWDHVMLDSATPYLPGKEGQVRKQVFDITISDSHGGATVVPFTIEYNSAPVLGAPTFDFASIGPGTPHFLGATTIGDTTELRFDFSGALEGTLFQGFIIDGFLPFFDPDHNLHAATRAFSAADSTGAFALGNLFADSIGVLDNGTVGQVHFQYGVTHSFAHGDHFIDAFHMDVTDARGGIDSHLFKFDLMA